MRHPEPKCPECKIQMQEGYVLDRTHGAKMVATWVEGEPKLSWLFGVDIRGRLKRPVASFRCPQCGLLLEFAL